MLVYDDLIIRCRQGDAEAFDSLFSCCEGQVFRLAATILGNEQDAEDVTQEVFLRLFRQIGKFQGQSSFTTWLTAIVVNACRDQLRRRKVRRIFLLDWLRGQVDHDDPDITGPVQERQQRQALWSLVDEMDEKHRLPVILFYQEGLSAGEVAQALNLPVKTIYSRLNTARQRLRIALNEYDYENAELLPGK